MYSECSQAARANLWPVGLKPLAWISYADSLTLSSIIIIYPILKIFRYLLNKRSYS